VCVFSILCFECISHRSFLFELVVLGCMGLLDLSHMLSEGISSLKKDVMSSDNKHKPRVIYFNYTKRSHHSFCPRNRLLVTCAPVYCDHEKNATIQSTCSSDGKHGPLAICALITVTLKSNVFILFPLLLYDFLKYQSCRQCQYFV
jgi:hypothetical protein